MVYQGSPIAIGIRSAIAGPHDVTDLFAGASVCVGPALDDLDAIQVAGERILDCSHEETRGRTGTGYRCQIAPHGNTLAVAPGRRDHVFIYSANKPKAIVKDQLKLKLPPPGENPIVAKFYNLYRDTREEYSVSTEVGTWGGQEFVCILVRHKQR